MAILASVALVGLLAQAFFDPGGPDGKTTPTAPTVPNPEFVLGFEQLHSQLGEAMGDPVEDEHLADDADAVQLTTKGLAVWRKGEVPSFTDGWHVWYLELPGATQHEAAISQRAVQQTTGPPSGLWDRLAACEASSNWATNSGNGYYGGLQEDMAFWRNHGGMAYAARPDLASRAAQIAVAERGLAAQGWGAWPACSRRLGLR